MTQARASSRVRSHTPRKIPIGQPITAPTTGIATAPITSPTTPTRSTTHPGVPTRSRIGDQGRMFTARATTRIATVNEMPASSIIVIFAQVAIGRVSVGLNAVAFVNARKR